MSLTRTCLGLALLLFCMSSCTNRQTSPAAEPRDYLVVSTEQQATWIRNFNPLIASGSARWSTLAVIYEPMFIYNRMSSEMVPWLASKMTWLDDSHRQLRIDLKPDIRWSDGRKFTAHDVVFTFKLLQRFAALDGNGLWTFLSDLRIAGEHAVIFDFKSVFSPGLIFLAQQPIVAKHIWQTIDDPVSFSNETPVGTGPYTEVAFFHSQSYQLNQNPHYWQDLDQGIQGLRFPAFSANDQAMLALLKGEIDISGNFFPAVERLYHKRDPEVNHYWFPLVGSMVFFYVNTQKSPYDLADVRKALSVAIDRPTIIKVGMFNYTKLPHSSGLTDAFRKWRSDAIANPKLVQYDPKAASSMLDQLGLQRGDDGWRRLPNGKVWQLDVTVVSGWSDWVRSAQVMVRNLRDIGIQAKLKTYDFGAWFDQLQRGEFESAIAWSPDIVDPYYFYRWLMASETVKPVGDVANGNWHRYANAKVDEFLTAYADSVETAKQVQAVAGMQREFLNDLPAIPLFPNPAWGLVHTRHFENFPTATNPYAVLSPNFRPEFLLVVTNLKATQRKKLSMSQVEKKEGEL